MKRNVKVWTGYDQQGIWTLHVRKDRGSLTLDEIRQACTEYDQDFYMLVIKAMDEDISQYYIVDDLVGDYVTLYRADDFFRWREKE